jgi:hypothetical protein
LTQLEIEYAKLLDERTFEREKRPRLISSRVSISSPTTSCSRSRTTSPTIAGTVVACDAAAAAAAYGRTRGRRNVGCADNDKFEVEVEVAAAAAAVAVADIDESVGLGGTESDVRWGSPRAKQRCLSGSGSGCDRYCAIERSGNASVMKRKDQRCAKMVQQVERHLGKTKENKLRWCKSDRSQENKGHTVCDPQSPHHRPQQMGHL